MEHQTRFYTFMRGWSSSLDYTGRSRIPVPDPSNGLQRDFDAIASDWAAVGSDMRSALDTIKTEVGCVPA